MHRIDITPAEATTLIALIASHLPIGYSLGWVYAATPQGLITTDRAAWGLDRGDGYAWRMVQISGSIYERTTWRDGTELSRRIVVRERPDDDANAQHRG